MFHVFHSIIQLLENNGENTYFGFIIRLCQGDYYAKFFFPFLHFQSYLSTLESSSLYIVSYSEIIVVLSKTRGALWVKLVCVNLFEFSFIQTFAIHEFTFVWHMLRNDRETSKYSRPSSMPEVQYSLPTDDRAFQNAN
jgi:hypothetical protein